MYKGDTMVMKKGVDGKTYNVVNGTYYHKNTPEKIIRILENARNSKRRLRFYFGNTKTGKDWDEIHGVVGYVGRSTGEIKIPLLIYNSRSLGGGALLTDAIVKIETSKNKNVLYKHPNYHK